MPKPTPEQVKAEIEKLESLLSRIKVKRSSFGTNHEEGLKTQIGVLKKEIDAAVLDPEEDETWDAAGEAQDWLDGYITAPPSKDWEVNTHLFNN